MKKRNIILVIGVLVGSIIGTQTFAEPVEKELGLNEVDRLFKTIKDNPQFSIFYDAIEQADLSEEIAKLDEMTLMIPSNRAFKLLPEDVLENFMDEENKDALIELINYHVLPKKIYYEELQASKQLNTLRNQSISISHESELKVENAVVEEKYAETDDVIIYKVDRLIMPLK